MSLREELVAKINLKHLRTNIRQFSRHVHPAKIMGVVKANAYGHGAVPVAKTLLEEGVHMLAVAIVDEAVELREAGVDAPLFLLGKVWPKQTDAAFEYGLEPLIASDADFELLAAASEERKDPLKVHLKIDTGMGRLGVLYNDWQEIFRRIRAHPYLMLNGVMSHLSTADAEDGEHTNRQHRRFREIRDAILETIPEQPPLFHLANSAGSLFYPDAGYDLVRLGLSMYGMPPAPDRPLPFELEQLLTLTARVAYVKKFPEGYPVGYGSTYRTHKYSTILVCAGGYEDGIPRRYGNTGEVLIRGTRFPIVGNVSMDTFMVDVGTAEVAVGDEVVVIGRQDEEYIPVWEMAEKLGVIPYEVTCGISPRVPRCYAGGNDAPRN